jgi:esterase FrsA
MAAQERTLEEVKREILRRAGKVNPFERTKKEDVEEVLGRLHSMEPDPWGIEWAKIGARYEARAAEQEKKGQSKEAGDSYYLAYEYYRIGRYPVPSSAEKMNCYRGALRNFLQAGKYLDPPVERVEIPFEGNKVAGYLQIPRGGVARPPIVMHWGGVDGWKEDSRGQSEALHRLGLATFVIDMPGAGENPLLGQEPRAERTFSAAMDFLETRRDIDGQRIAVMGRSFGGYWAAKLAYVEAKRLKGAVNWGAGIHYTFEPEWLRPALTERASQYLMGPASLLDSRSYIFRVKTLEEVLKIAPTLSLKTQGLLDRPSAPLLFVNGKHDDQHPVEDIYLAMEHGDPKEARIFADGGHMGRVPGQRNDEALKVATEWLKRRLTEH